jgi:hypothetical protein
MNGRATVQLSPEQGKKEQENEESAFLRRSPGL